MRLWLPCLPPPSDAPPLPPYLRQRLRIYAPRSLFALSGHFLSHRGYSSAIHVSVAAPASSFNVRASIEETSRYFTSPVAAQALSILTRLLPGAEEYAHQALGEILHLLTSSLGLPLWGSSNHHS